MFSPTFRWMLQALAWDGALPLLVVVMTFSMRILLQKQEDLLGLIIILTPLGFAFLRAHLADGQLCRLCGGEAPILRQIAIAAAIVFLLIFEILTSILPWANQVPLEAWLFPAGSYCGYLVTILWALRPLKREDALTKF